MNIICEHQVEAKKNLQERPTKGNKLLDHIFFSGLVK
jgi:hypothetical protein